jgi:hypothetical protein
MTSLERGSSERGVFSEESESKQEREDLKRAHDPRAARLTELGRDSAEAKVRSEFNETSP